MTQPAEHEGAPRPFVPAAGHDWLLPFYDAFTKLLGASSALRALVEQANAKAGQRVLEIGCGTGNLTLLVKHAQPGAEVVGLDPDPKALARAQRKADRAGLSLALDQGFSQELPYGEATFDLVLSSFMLHHLELETKAETLRETCRVLRPDGALHLLDFGAHAEGLLARLVHSHEALRDNEAERVLGLMREAGFQNVELTEHRTTLFGRVNYYRAAQ